MAGACCCRGAIKKSRPHFLGLVYTYNLYAKVSTAVMNCSLRCFRMNMMYAAFFAVIRVLEYSAAYTREPYTADSSTRVSKDRLQSREELFLLYQSVSNEYQVLIEPIQLLYQTYTRQCGATRKMRNTKNAHTRPSVFVVRIGFTQQHSKEQLLCAVRIFYF